MSNLIDRQTAIDAVKSLPDCANGYSDTYDKARIIAVLEDVPSAETDQQECEKCIFKPFKQFQPERKKGKWVYNDYGNRCWNWHCSVCNNISMVYNGNAKYCSNCGAEMIGEANV